MGLLDDAIREHLELKRQRGADEDEVARLEREALGPVVRGDEFATDVTSGEDESLPPEYEPLVAEPEPFEPEPPRPELAEHVGQPTEEFDVESAQAQEALNWAPPEPEPVSPEPASHEPPPPAPAPPAPAPAHDEDEAGTSEHDVLEETPDFLQETPEHDRLWFEQGPPQKFDFDK